MFMNLLPPWNRSSPERIKRRLASAFRRDFGAAMRRARRAPASKLSEHLRVLTIAARIQSELERASCMTFHELASAVEQCGDDLCRERSAGPLGDDVLFGRMFVHLAAARQAFQAVTSDSTSVRHLVIPTDLLFSLHQTLFPAERMAVGAGRLTDEGLVLGASFDVTSTEVSRTTYSRADPSKLADALLAIERSGAQLALWAHSHPGSTAVATHPSAIDRRQWAAWSEDFQQLLGAIMTGDGCVRFWGDPVESGALRVHLEGSGYERVEPHVYRITTQSTSLALGTGSR